MRFNWNAPILVSSTTRRRDLPLRQHRREIGQPGRVLDRDQPRPDDQRHGQDAQRHAAATATSSPARSPPSTNRPCGGRALGRHGRRPGLGDQGRRQELDQGQRQDRRQSRVTGSAGWRPRPPIRGRLCRPTPGSATTISGLILYKTTDYGQTWTSIAGNLPNEPVNVVREDPKNPDLLFAGTDCAVYVSLTAASPGRR